MKVRMRLIYLFLILMGSIDIAGANEAASGDTSLTVWATVGPLAYLAKANVLVTNASRKVIGHGVTNERGVVIIRRMNPRNIIFPLSIHASGGVALGKKFKGNLAAETASIGLSSNVVFLDLISTAAKKISSPALPYSKALQSVRRALAIGDELPDGVIRVQNPFVRLDRLELEEKQSGGFYSVVKNLSRAAKSGKPYYKLQEIKFKINGSSEPLPQKNTNPILLTSVATSTSASTCSADQINNPPPKGGQPNVIDTYGTALMEELGANAGLKATGTRALIPGMVFGVDPITAGEQQILDAIANVQKQLDCIDEKIDYLTAQVSAMQVQLSLQDADYCKNSQIIPLWNQYEAYLNSYSNYDEESKKILIASFNNAITVCGAVIDKGLFQVPSGASASAWQTTFKNAQDKHGGFLFPSENQELQIFLQDWNYITYKYFVIATEYYNSQGAFSLAASTSGYNLEDSRYCSDLTTSSSTSFCVWEKNISKATPATIYSDEVAIIRTGMGVNAVPGIEYPGTKCSGTYYNGVCYGGGPQPMRILTALSIPQHQEGLAWGSYYGRSNFSILNSKPLNTSDVNTAIETYESPRAYRDRYIYNSDITEASSYQTDVATFYLDAITNEAYIQNSVWKGLTASQVSFGSYESTAKISTKQYKNTPNFYDVSVNPNAVINNIKSQTWCMTGDSQNPIIFFPNCGDQHSPYPMLGLLFGRPWWTDSAKASTFSPPNPKCYEKVIPAGVQCG